MKKWTLYFSLLCLFFVPFRVDAGAPDCGVIDREDILRDVYRDARKLKYVILDIRDDIDVLCGFMEEWHVWEEDDAREDILEDDDEYQQAREALVRRTLKDLGKLKHSIFLYRTWREVDPVSSMQEAKQIAYMNKSYTYITNFRSVALSRRTEINVMMKWNSQIGDP